MLSGVIGHQNGGTISHCRIIRNTVENAGRAQNTIVEYGRYGGGATDVTFASDMASLAADVTFPEADGWSSYWGVESGVIKFNGKLLAPIALSNQTVEPANGNYTVNLSAVSGNITSVTIGGNTVGTLTGKTLTIAKSALAAGDYIVVVTTDGGEYTFVLTLDAVVTALAAKSVTVSSGAFAVDFTEDSITGTVTKVTVGDVDVTANYASGVLTLAKSDWASGEYTVSVITADKYDYACTVTLAGGSVVTLANGVVEWNATSGKFELDLSEVLDGATVLSAKAGETAAEISGGVIKFSNEVTFGTHTVTVITDGANDYTGSYVFVTKALNSASDVKTFLQRGAISDGYYILTKDIYFNGDSLAIAETTLGTSVTLDGMGHRLYDFVINGAVTANPYMIKQNDGTIRNLAVSYTLTQIKGTYQSFIGKNTGTVENIFAELTLAVDISGTGLSNFIGVITGEESGHIKNCVTSVHVLDGYFVGTTNANQLAIGAIVAHASGAQEIRHCYGIRNTAENEGKLAKAMDYLSRYGFSGASDTPRYDDMAALLAAKTLPASDGWSEYWGRSGNVLTFNGKAVTDTALPAQTVEKNEGSAAVSLAAVTGTVTALTVDGVNALSALSDGTLTLSNPSFGEHRVFVETAECNYKLSVFVLTKVLTQENAGTPEKLKALLTANPDGYFVLGSDLNMGGNLLQYVETFSGILDGEGYAIRNTRLHGWSGASMAIFIKTNTGTIRNVAFYLTNIDCSVGSNTIGLVKENKGIIENVYVSANVSADSTYFNSYRQAAGIASSNEADGAVIRNCIVNLQFEEGYDTLAENNSSGILATYNKSGNTMQNNYAICNVSALPAIKYAWGTQSNNTKYASVAEFTAAVTSLPAANGWSEYWRLTGDSISMSHSA